MNYSYTDHQGKQFDVEASSQSEADILARFEANARDEFIKQGEWHVGNVDEVIQDTYNNAFWWHNNRISEGGDPRSGLRGLPYVPWDENIDGVAAMQGAIGGLSDSSYARNGAPAAHPQPETGGRGLIIFALLGLMLTCMWAVCYSSGVTLEMAP